MLKMRYSRDYPARATAQAPSSLGVQMFTVHTIPETYDHLAAAAEAAGVEHSGRIAEEGDVLASNMIWLGDTLIAYVAYTTGQDIIVSRSLQDDEVTTLTLEEAVEMIKAHTA